MKKNILIIDDEVGICTSLTYALRSKYNVKSAVNPNDGIKYMKEECFNICLLDLKIGEYNGLDVLEQLRELDNNMIVIIITAYGSINSTVEAIKKGAYTYLTKPLNIADLYMVIEQALEYQELNDKVEYLSRELENKYVYNGIIGKSPSMKNVFEMIDRLKDVDTNVVITGESGTGKELAARAIHYSGKRKKERFAEVNCAAIPEGLLEEELFGHKKGSFTGAIEDKQGKFQYANNGTIFLDEIGDMPFSLQAKLLRVLQQKEYTPIGGNEPIRLNVRVIAATNKDLRTMVDQGEFRQDLFFRLNVVEISLPPLREKKQDLPLLFSHFIQLYNNEMEKSVIGLSKDAERKLLDYNYPGNIRELGNIIEYAMVMSNGKIIESDVLPLEVKNYEGKLSVQDKIFAEDLIGLPLKEVEKRIIKATLLKNGGHVRTTADMLKISDKGLRNKISEYGIKL